ncbi:FAD1 flavin adenine dinucleotide synthetase [Chamberlinius hualienensis]
MAATANRRLKALFSVVHRLDGKLQRHLKTTSMASINNFPGKTAAILVIGDEILKGQTLETNSNFICKALYNLGFKVKRIVVIPDDVDEIASHVNQLSNTYDYVLTSGGIGPTHDDITYEGVAKAFDKKLIRHPSLVDLISKYFGNDPAHPAYKMSEIPENAEVLLTPDKPGRFPLVNINNVYILPGIPKFLERSFQCFIDKLDIGHLNSSPNLKILYITLDELSITSTLNSAVKHFKDRVIFGSYPSVSHSYYRVRITMESEKLSDVLEAKEYLERELPKSSLIEYDTDPVCGAAEKLFSALDNSEHFDAVFHKLVKESVDILMECVTKKYQPSEICVSFNGGKDCTALLHLYHTALQKLFPDSKLPIKVLYIRCQNPFSEMEDFIRESKDRYNLNVCTLEGSIKEGLKNFLSANPEIKVILMGNRRTDPNSKLLKTFQATDCGWPCIMRVFPILDWTYKDVWRFIRHFQLPYCQLYDNGYSSLGSRHNTERNPKLCEVDTLGNIRYRPAYELDEAESERDGRSNI